MAKKAISLDNLATFKEQYDLLLEGALSNKQDTLVSGTNIKTINNESILGSGNITIQGGGGAVDEGDAQGSAKQEGNNLTTWGVGSFAEGLSSTDATERGLDENSTESEILEEWNSSDPEGDTFTATKGEGSHVEGNNGLALGKHSHVEGNGCVATGNSAHAEGTGTQSLDKYTHAEGLETVAEENAAHSEGQHTTASGKASHAEGRVRPYYEEFTDRIKSATTESTLYQTLDYSLASDIYEVDTKLLMVSADGGQTWSDVSSQNITVTQVYGGTSKWFKLSKKLGIGNLTTVNCKFSLPEELYDSACGAKAEASHTEGINTQATNAGEHAEGRYNKSNNHTIHSIGIGTSTNDRKNAVEVLDDGSVYVKGIGGYNGANVDNANDLKTAMQAFATERLIRIPNTVSDVEAATYTVLDNDCTPVYVNEPRRYQLSSYEELGHGDARVKYVNITKDEIREIMSEPSSPGSPEVVTETVVPITPVTANPTLAGTEPNLTGLQVGDTKYAVPGWGGGSTDVQINGTSIVSSDVANIITETAYDASTNKIATMADVPVISNPLAGKKVSLIGDSITTWSTVKPDNTYLSRYPSGVIQTIDQTWWYQMITNGGMTLLRNTAYNGSSCTGRDGGNGHNTASTTDAYAACSDKRINDLSDETSNPDIVICFIGINDFGSDKNTPTGNYIGLDVVPSDSATGMATFSEGYALMLKKIATKYPAARIYCCTLPSVGHGSVSDTYTTRWFGGSFPVYNTTTHAYLADYNNTIRTLAHNMGAGIIEFAECINWFNSSSLLEDGLHPNIDGMKLLGDKALAKLQSDFAVVNAQ